MKLSRREFCGLLSATAGMAMLGSASHLFARDNELNILCWEGYNSDTVLGPFRRANPGSTVRAQTGTSDPAMINRLRAGETGVWDLINVNQPWARGQLYPEGLIRALDQDRFLPGFERMMDGFNNPPYPLAFGDDGALIGIPQRFGPFSFVVNTDVISRATAEEQGWNLFLDPAMRNRYGVLTYDNWNVIHLCLTAGINPFEPADNDALAQFRTTTAQVLGGARLLTDDLMAMNTALINGEIDAYFTGGTYTASSARFDGLSQVRGITPRSGPVDGKGGVVWVEVTSAVNNPSPSRLADAFLEFMQTPEISKAVAFADGTYNPVTQMGDPEVMRRFDSDELDAIQWDSLDEELERSVEYQAVASYDALMDIYTAVRRS